MDMERLNDMLERYGELCTQTTAAKILSVTPRTIYRMAIEGRLRKVGKSIDVRSICKYIESAPQIDFIAKVEKAPQSKVSREVFLEAARRGRWAARK